MSEEAYNAANAVHQTIKDMVTGYEQLAQSGKAGLENLNSTIGQLKQWKAVSPNPPNMSPLPEEMRSTYSDNPPSWIERIFSQKSYSQVDHPQRQRAYEELAKTQGIVKGVDQHFELDATDMRDSVKSMADHMKGWLDTATKLRALIIPHSPMEINSGGGDLDGWVSTSTAGIYATNVAMQDDAQNTTLGVIRSAMEQQSTFLKAMKEHLVAFAEIARDEKAMWTELATDSWIPKKLTLDFVLEKIRTVAAFVQEKERLHVQQVSAMIGMLNDTLDSVLTVEKLKDELVRMSSPAGTGGQGWPMPQSVAGNSRGTPPGEDSLRYNVLYFKAHIKYWSGLADQFNAVNSAGREAPAIQPMFLKLPGFNATTTSSLNSLADDIRSQALSRGRTAMTTMSQNLDATIRGYLHGEEVNTETAKRLEKLLDE